MSQRIDEEEKREESAGKKMEEVLFYGVSGNNYIYSGNDRHCCLCRVRGVGGIRAEDDIFGVTVLGVITAVGGGMIRDVTLGIIPPGVFQKPVYAAVAVLTSVLVFFLLYFKRELLEGNVTYDKVMLVMDSVGLGIFTVVGVNTGIRQGFADNTFLLVFVGTITGVGGGLLRDMMAEVPPYIFVKHIYACASIVGAIVCVYTYRLFGVVASLIFGSAAVILMRYLAAHYRWNLPKLK